MIEEELFGRAFAPAVFVSIRQTFQFFYWECHRTSAMRTRVPSKVKVRGGSEYYPRAFCQDDGEMTERAESMVLIKLRSGGEESGSAH